MALMKVLITVKTYPSLSEKYDELVCTAGLLEDGTWIRIYPVPFRKLDYQNRYEKWHWIELDLVKNTSDFRPESYRPANLDKEIRILGKVDTKCNWAFRKEIALKSVISNLSELIDRAKKEGISLAVVKPKRIINFIWEPCEREWDKKKIDKIIANQAQGSLFDVEETKIIFKVVDKIPYKFSYVFTTEDDIERTIMIEDWELGALYWNCLRDTGGDEEFACKKVKEKYFDYMSSQRDLYFFMGTTFKFHNVAPNPFIIIGAFYPPKIDSSQLSLF
jgi:hypothetical protein